MTKRDEWASRVAEWRSSGLTSAAFTEGKPFTAGGLRHWAFRLKTRQPRKALRVVRVQRIRRTAPVASGGRADTSLVIELGAARVVLRPGFDRATLAAVLEVALAAGTGRAA
jgi:hypothetical protein